MKYYTEILPEEIVCIISDYLEISIFDNKSLFTDLFPLCNQHDVQTYRKSPLRLLRQLTNQPNRLLELMTLTGTCLSGSRAVEYFTPGFATSDSDWDFYCESDYYNSITFIHGMVEIGMEITTRELCSKVYETVRVRMIIAGKMCRNDKSNNIQIMTSDSKRMIDFIPTFHSTIVQCYIFGGYAISLYHELSKSYMSVRWRYNDRKACYKKYEERGAKYITYNDAAKIMKLDMNEAHRWEDISSSHVYTVPLSSYYTDKSDMEICAQHEMDMLRYMTKWRTTSIGVRFSGISMVNPDQQDLFMERYTTYMYNKIVGMMRIKVLPYIILKKYISVNTMDITTSMYMPIPSSCYDHYIIEKDDHKEIETLNRKEIETWRSISAVEDTQLYPGLELLFDRTLNSVTTTESGTRNLVITMTYTI